MLYSYVVTSLHRYMLIDYHLHNHFSSDSETSTTDIAEKAMKIGIQEICITNHIETFDPKTSDGIFSYKEAINRFAEIQKEIQKIQKEFPNLPIKFGAELEYIEEWMPEMKRFTEEMDFDFLIGSIHVEDGVVISSSELSRTLYERVTEEYAYKKYFELLYAMVKWGNFDVVGHFDVNKKGGYEVYGPFKPKKYETEIKNILQLMKKKEIGIELNTSYLHKNCKELFPHPDILKWCVEIGIEHFTIGSDAHEPEEVGQNLDEALKIAKEAGITTISTYEKRKPTTFQISEF